MFQNAGVGPDSRGQFTTVTWLFDSAKADCLFLFLFCLDRSPVRLRGDFQFLCIRIRIRIYWHTLVVVICLPFGQYHFQVSLKLYNNLHCEDITAAAH